MTEGDDHAAAAQGDQQQHAEAVAAAGSNAVDITPEKNGGVFKEILTPGTGEETPGDGCSVSVHYTGKLVDGTEFDSSRLRGKFDFNLGTGSVIKAWEIGIKTMKKGEVAILTCAPDYAYGDKGSPPKIPPNATLIFEVELLEWKLEDISVDNDGSVQRRILSAGELYTTPKEESTVKVHLKGLYENRVFEERDVEFVIGEGADHGVIKAGNAQFNIPPNATVEYEVTLKSFENVKENWEMDAPEKVEQGEICKSKGTAFLKAEKYNLALGKYRRAVTLLEHDALEGELNDRRNALLLATNLNMALCYNKLNDPLEAIRACNGALALDPRSEKALFRRGQAYIASNEFELARKDFEEVLKIDSNNKAARNQLSICTVKLKQQLQKERQMYKHIFERMAAQNDTNAPASAAKEPGKEEPLEPGVWNRSEENNQEAATPEESKTAIEADKEVPPPPPESVPAST
ncbi:hypothetical protein MTO96_021897 [Rhipicephalus appendiculatus]